MDGSVDIGGAFLSQSGLASSNVLTASGQLRYTATEFALGTNALVARTPDERFTGQGVLTASRYAPASDRLRWELTGTASAFGLSGVAPSFAWQALAREHLRTRFGGVYAGVSTGQVDQSNVARAIAGAHAGGFVRVGAEGQDELSLAAAYSDAGRMADSLGLRRYADGLGYWAHHADRLELSAGGGVRFGTGRQSVTDGWASANAAIWMTERVAVVLSGGRALADVTRGVPSVRYLSLSLRIGPSPAAARSLLPVRHERASADGRLDVHAGDDSLRILTLRLTTASTVELMADFTDWEPVALDRVPNGDWRLERVIASGTHHVAIRVDGGPWIVPPNLPRVSDDFGGDVGILIVP